MTPVLEASWATFFPNDTSHCRCTGPTDHSRTRSRAKRCLEWLFSCWRFQTREAALSQSENQSCPWGSLTEPPWREAQ